MIEPNKLCFVKFSLVVKFVKIQYVTFLFFFVFKVLSFIISSFFIVTTFVFVQVLFTFSTVIIFTLIFIA